MAWTSLNTLGTAQNKTSGTSLAITTSAAAEAGNVVILVTAADNTSTGADGDNGESSAPTDSAGGNTWVKAKEFTNTQSAAAAGATVAVYYSKLTNQIASGGTITANWGSAIVAKGINAWEFSIGAGSTLSISGSASLAADAAEPGSMTLSALANQEYLFFRAVATEGNLNAIDVTKTVNYTLTDFGTTSGGGAATNMTGWGEFRVFTGTGDTSNPTGATADNASVYFALKETLAASDTLLGAAMV